MKRVPASSLPVKAGKLSDTKTATASRPRRSVRAALLLFSLLLLLLGLLVLPNARRETSRREAYLPQLEAEAHRNPLDGRLLALLGGRLVQAGEYQAAADTFRRALATGEQNSLLWINLAAATAASGDKARALADLRVGMGAQPKALELSQALTRVQALTPDTSPMMVAHTISPEGPVPLIDLYAAGSFLNGFEEYWGRRHPETSGFATRAQWARAKPEDAEVQRLWGLALLHNRRFLEASEALERAVSLAPRSDRAHLAFAEGLDAAGLDTRATVAYLETLQLHPNWLPALLGVGSTSLESGMNKYAITGFHQATVVDPKSVDAWIGLGRAYRKNGVDHDKAIAAFQTAAKLAPNRTDYYDDYADALRQAVQWPAAETLLRKRLQSASSDPLAHYLLAMVLLNNNPTPERQTEAESETREALRLFPHNTLADIQLAQIVLSKQDAKQAIDLLTDALQSNPFNRNAMSVLARAYRQSGQTDLSEKVSKQSERLFADQQRIQVLEDLEARQIMNVSTHEELARLYPRIGETKKANYEQSMVQLLRDDPRKAEEQLKAFESVRSATLSTK